MLYITTVKLYSPGRKTQECGTQWGVAIKKCKKTTKPQDAT